MDPASAFATTPDSIYLDSATYGLPPIPTVTAMRRALDRWQDGSGDWMEDWDRPAESCRAAFATLAGLHADGVALLPAVSVGVGLIAAGLGPQDEVVVPTDEFTSVLFPLLVARARGATVREVPFASLAEAIQPGTTLVAFSLVQMQTGLRAALGDIVARAREVGARTLVDATQAVPFLDPSEDLAAVDVLVCAAYKHLLSPRGVALMYVGPEARSEIEPLVANWRAADEPYGRYFGGPLTLAGSAARYDVSLAWIAWVGAVESLGLLVEWRRTGAFERVRAQSRRLADGLGLAPPASTLVCSPIRDARAAREALRGAGVRGAVRGDAIRLAPHVYSRDADIDTAVLALAPFVVAR
jgi:selenocysteine lyase/cysteine desulfurase